MGTLKKLQTLAEELKTIQVTGESLQGAVRITLSGHNEMVRVEIHPDAMHQSPQTLEKAIQEAYTQATENLRTLVMDKLGAQVPNGLPFLPGNFGLG